jgi:replicative DNA helicase|nr:MAG TPA: DnaB-like replicative helicase [Caudoviricetes sp.]
MKKFKDSVKFSFTPDFQLEILRFILRDKEGGLVLRRVKSSYLVLIEHALIFEGISKYFKKQGKMPSENILKQVIKELLESKAYVDLVTKDDLPSIQKLISNLYHIPLSDSEYIKERIYQFSTYVEMKNLNDSFDLDNFEQYEEYSRKIEKVLQKSKPKKEDEPLYMIRDVTERQFKRQSEPSVIPCPYRQLNDLTNAGGYPEHSVNVILDKPKAKKTFFMVNLARGYLRMKKSVLYIDTENGQDQIMDRFIQSSINKTKKELYSGEYDKLEAKHLRKLARFGVELVVERVPAMITDVTYIREKIIQLRNQGIDIRVLMVDYAGKLASISRDREDFERISNVYIDLSNLAEEMKLDIIWTAHHITREGKKHRKTRYDENDISGSIAIVRNAQVIMGLNATEQEERDDILRAEIVVQRDGLPSGRALFKCSTETQRCTEFTREQRKEYDRVYGEQLDNSLKSSSNPDANMEKYNKKQGDI